MFDELAQAAGEKSAAGQENERERNLADDQRLAEKILGTIGR
jgi:hypothetical protein